MNSTQIPDTLGADHCFDKWAYCRSCSYFDAGTWGQTHRRYCCFWKACLSAFATRNTASYFAAAALPEVQSIKH